MLRSFSYSLLVWFTWAVTSCFGQNESNKWYFGWNAGLDFMTNPPTILTGSMVTQEGCASIADAAGNLLFYTDGLTVYNSTHAVMSNGNGLMGNGSTTQAAVIVKQPGNPNKYFVFTNDDVAGIDGLRYSEIDMSLSAGQGSVTVKNVFIVNGITEKLTSVRHCNGTDVWVMVHDNTASNFRAFQVSSAGVNTTAVVSAVGQGNGGLVGYMKFSPNGKKLALAVYSSSVQVFDFDPATGVVTNSLGLPGATAYGCEFSPDGTKLYASGGTKVYQWDLCAGSPTAIAASLYTVTATSPWGMQLASNGKIYVTRYTTSTLGVVDNPNIAGSGCNYVDLGQSISPNTARLGLPNFITSSLAPPATPFTHTVSNSFGCQTASFTAPPVVQNFSLIGCAASGYSLNSMLWIFGDPASGSANTSTLTNPSHAFTNLGTYTTSLIMYYTCGGGTDTIKQVVNINQPCISVSSTSITCANLGSATVQATGGIGPFSYTWMPTGQTNSVATGLSPGVYTLTVFDFGNNFTYTAMATFNSLIPLSGMLANSSSVSCNGAATASAAITGITGGSGTQNYLWTNGVTSYTAPNPQNLTAGNYTYTVTDALTGCIINGGFFISQPPALTLSIAAGSPTTCAGTGVTITGTAYGGLPYPVGSPYTYSWTGGPTDFSYTPVQALAGNYTYTLSATDSKSCQVLQTETLSVIANPTLNVTSVQICPLQTGTLNAFGASSYTWNGLFTGSSYADNPLSTTVYTVTGSAQGCSATAKTGTITLKSVPLPTLTTNSPRCNGSSLLLNGSGGSTYNWSGPLLFNSALQNPTITPVGLTNAGVYNLTVTAANGCTASTSANVVINPTPTLSALGSTVCVSNPASLTANSVAGATYLWTGPGSYTSNIRNSILPGASGTMTGTYTVLVTSVNGCTNTTSVSLVVVPSPSPGITLSTNSICAQALSGSVNMLTAIANGGLTYTLTAPAYVSVSNPSGPNSALTIIAPFTPGPVNVNLNAHNGVCSVSTTAVFTIIANPVITASPANAVICQGRTFTFNATGASSYTWSPAAAGILSYSAGAMVIVSPSLSTVFSVYGSSVGCNSGMQNTNLTVNPLPVIVPDPLSTSICLYNRSSLRVNGTATSHTWSPATGLNTTIGSSVIAGPLASQNYTILGSLNSCTSTAVVSVFVLPLPVPSLSLSANAVCLNQSITAQGFGGVDYLWTDPIGFTRLGQTTSFLINNSGYAGTHTLLVTDQNGCKATRTFVISVYDLPNGILSGSQMQGCVPFCSDFSFYSASPLNVLWQLDGKTMNGNTFSHCFNQVGQYHITGNLQDTITGCANVQDFVVNAWPRPQAGFEFYPVSPVESLDEVIFTNTSKGEWQTKWHWYFISNAGFQSDHENSSYTFSQAGIYPVAMVVSNQMGCSDTITKAITVEQDFNIYVPNAFTPNEDGLNELFRPVLRGAQSFQLSVYNRWGQKLYETSDFNSGWDGTYKGQPCKQEVYIWKLNVKSLNKPSYKTGMLERNMTGQVMLYR